LALPLLLAAALTCNDPRLGLIDGVVRKGVSDGISSGGRTAIDALWVIDNSGSMCQEQKNLIESFRTFVTGLSQLDADLQMGVVTTDMVDRAQSGRFQNTPAKDFRVCVEAKPEAGVYYCAEDGDCGEGGCLCGIPHLLRCETDADCREPDEAEATQALRCVASGHGSQVRFCSAPCSTHSDCQRALTSEKTDALMCGEPPQPPAGGADKYCLLRVCTGDFDCVTESGYRCIESTVEGDGDVSYCRQFVNLGIGGCSPGERSCPLDLVCRDDRTCPRYAQCPAPTCDCPKDLANTMRFQAGRTTGETVEAAVRDFRCLATVGTSGDATEKGLSAIRHALSTALIEEDHPGFPRKDAHLLIVILSDEDDCTGDERFFEGSGAQCDERGNLQCVWCRDDLEDVVGIADFIKSRKRSPYQVAVAAIVGDDLGVAVPQPTEPSPSCSSANGVAFAGARYAALQREFGRAGVVESICSESFEGPLERIASLVVGLANRFCLTEPLARCFDDAACPSGSTCGYYWGDSGQCRVGTAYTGEACHRDRDCTTHGAECDDRRHCRIDESHPTLLEVRVTREGATTYDVVPPDGWTFVPNGAWGCLRFTPEAEPGPEDAVDIRYNSSVVP